MHFLIFLLLAGRAMGFDFFKSDIDYWNKGKEQPAVIANVPDEKPKFDWQKHMDPKNEEFFREGDHLPPAPFIEVMRDPSDENLRHWFAYIETKNDLSKNLHQRMKEYLSANKPPGGEKMDAATLKPPPITSDLATRFRLRFYFHSLCHHCQRMIETANALQDHGFLIEGFQIDRDLKNLPPMRFALQRADPQDLKARSIESWPVLLVGDLRNKKVFRINGYKSFEEIQNILSKI